MDGASDNDPFDFGEPEQLASDEKVPRGQHRAAAGYLPRKRDTNETRRMPVNAGRMY